MEKSYNWGCLVITGQLYSKVYKEVKVDSDKCCFQWVKVICRKIITTKKWIIQLT